MSPFPVTAEEIHVNKGGRQNTIWAMEKPEFKEEVRGEEEEGFWGYTGECIFILDVDEEGKITRVLEFRDSLATERLRGLMGRARGRPSLLDLRTGSSASITLFATPGWL